MHKVRLTQNNYQLVAENRGQFPEVLMSNYNETLDSEKRMLSSLVKVDFYPQETESLQNFSPEIATVLQAFQNNPELSKIILHAAMLSTMHRRTKPQNYSWRINMGFFR